MTRARIRLPATAKPGEIVEIKTLVTHPMESGQRKDSAGNPIPRRMLTRMTAQYNGREVISADLHPGISANPYISFFAKVTESGTFTFTWTDEDGGTVTETAVITVG
ncbi:MAG: thiosulfate oxidation carrier complex protein SoxZ [Pseudomonadota bacterium]|jgi:sulfur-oxidizing protein SoxZ